MAFIRFLSVVTALTSLVSAHTAITYPGWRGDNLHTSGLDPAQDPSTIGVDYVNGTYQFPYGMQWIYPCGGMPLSQNRTKWPVTGGAVAFQPGYQSGHGIAFIYVNVGITGPGMLNPPNMSHPVVPPFQIVGPSNDKYDANICLPQVPLPPNLTFKVGDNITIQLVETAQHGASLYNCVDVTLAEPEDCAPVTPEVCFNSSNIGFRTIYTTTSQTSGASVKYQSSMVVMLVSLLAAHMTLVAW
ncbi:hypothetical protein K461DRAFT_258367 [Myriangium duriaei CBS 260.36]|uniref:Copper acquisition factor BIM1-like domain-containing protein n=1 Tax=Myriangium duriaei CBS 260.36 TaxID=1168546 RepID=A0A9P4IZ00_9PEZI|nr:hypothetical protein K461DRAFT_258367 [Myriangium duriaei CBS 260.36]